MAYKINSFNYAHVRNSLFKNGVATTAKAYGISKTTLRHIKEHATFDEYSKFIANKSREQYERRLKRQRERLFGTTVKNGLHFDDNITLNKPVEKVEPKPGPKDAPFETEAGLGLTRIIVTDVPERKEEQPKGEVRNTIGLLPDDRKKRRRSRWPDMTPEMYNKAISLARNGSFKKDICEALGYPNAATLNYQLTKNYAWAAGFARACEEGREEYKKRWGEATGSRARAEAARQAKAEGKKKEAKTDDGLSAYERGLVTGAKKNGMTVEEYKQWRKDKLVTACKKRWDAYYESHPDKAPSKEKVVASVPTPTSTPVSAPATVPIECSKATLREKKEDTTTNVESRPPMLEKKAGEMKKTVLYEKRYSTARGWNSLLESAGLAIKIVAFGGLALALAQAAQIILLAVK